MIDTSLCCYGFFFNYNLSTFVSSVDEINSEINRKGGNGRVIQGKQRMGGSFVKYLLQQCIFVSFAYFVVKK